MFVQFAVVDNCEAAASVESALGVVVVGAAAVVVVTPTRFLTRSRYSQNNSVPRQ